MSEKKPSTVSWALLVISLAVVLVVKVCPPPEGLSAAGFQILGILLVAVILFLSWGIGWTSMFMVFLLMTVPGLGAAKVTQATFGNNTAVFLLFCFMLAACLTESGIARRVAIWFLTNKLARRGPWWTIAMYFAAVYLLDLVLSSATCIMIFLPILLHIFESDKLTKGKNKSLTSMLLLCTVAVALLSNGTNPISHAVTIQGFSLYESYVGEPMDFFTFTAITTPISLICVVLTFLIVRYLWRPDVTPFSNIDYDVLAASCGKLSKREKWSAFFYLLCVFFWLLPGLSKYLWPSAYPALSKINNCIPPLMVLFLMNLIRVDGEPILSWEQAIKAVNWPTFLFIAAIMGLGSFMGNADIGISAWLSGTLAPLFTNVSPIIFVLIMVFIVDLLTNFCSNSVALAVVFALALPICMNVYGTSLSPMLVSILITSSAMNGWATSPATPTAAVAYSTGWVNPGQVLKWGCLIMLIHVSIFVPLGFALANVLI